MRRSRFRNKEAELDITSFMNLMIILVPVLLMSMVFSHISVLDLKLPDIASNSQASSDKKNDGLELVILKDEMVVNYPAGTPLRRLPKVTDAETAELVHDFKLLSTLLQEIKRQLKDQGKEKRDILILSQPETDYQTIVKAMDTVRSYKAVVAASVVDAELFPAISLGDAPVAGPAVKGTSTK
ncbi:ExbD/TolR family protein [Agaribacterium haliotis]|uniref:ExbD/TolR family protein n=1 Tax=Agaribacterium haliotis TaxID=2013869 RepID=UPI000BB53C62|nr:biopolymer transporter ExbD [Agaribacterium haliotis]